MSESTMLFPFQPRTLFLANVSHEVRTPLSSVIAATELLMDTEQEPGPERFVQIVHRNGQRLMHLVDDILDFSRLEARQVVLRARPFGVREVVEGVAEWAVSGAHERDLTISLVVDESVPTTVIGDGLRVSQVLTNLVQNAIKFTEAGGVEVRVTSRTRAPDPRDGTQIPTWVEFTDTDTGIGIGEDHLHVLFDLMGGQLRTLSTIGEGSTFTFGVPLEHFDEGNAGVQAP